MRNNGPDPAPVTLIDHLPGGVTFQSVSGATCGAPPPPDFAGALICDVGTVASGETKVVTIVVKVGTVKKSTITNTVEVAVASGITDPFAPNNSASITVRVK